MNLPVNYYSNDRSWTHPSGSPRLFLAPMEGLGDIHLRKALYSIGGFDEACTEFLRVPSNAHVASLSKKYNYSSKEPTLAVQVMGQDPDLIAEMTLALIKRGAPRIDLNCGCPSNTVVGRGAGSSLLKTPEHLYQILKTMVEVATVPITAKLRSGFEDTSLFKENLLAAQESGIAFLTLHPRTKVEGYKAPVNWELIAKAKELLTIPVVGNGDIVSIKDLLEVLKITQCNGIMIGRGAVRDPWIFRAIKAHFEGNNFVRTEQQLNFFLDTYYDSLNNEGVNERSQVNKLKSIAQFLMKQTPSLQESLFPLLRQKPKAKDFLYMLKNHLLEKGPYERE
jgi:tRNA-dihydrouridine synthase C